MKNLEHLTVILPAAGEGRRLGLDIPKELYEILPGKRLIDFSMELIPKEVKKTAVVIKEGKESIPGYLLGRYPEHKFEFVYFNENYREWPGSVYSAKDHFSDYNAVLLPDTWLLPDRILSRPEGGGAMLERFVSLLKEYPAVFAAKKARGKVLRSLGALYLNERGKVEAFADKPEKEFDRFNAFWCVYGFRGESGEEVYRALIDSVEKKSDEDRLPFSAGGFIVADYFDLGTPERIALFKEKNTVN